MALAHQEKALRKKKAAKRGSGLTNLPSWRAQSRRQSTESITQQLFTWRVFFNIYFRAQKFIYFLSNKGELVEGGKGCEAQHFCTLRERESNQKEIKQWEQSQYLPTLQELFHIFRHWTQKEALTNDPVCTENTKIQVKKPPEEGCLPPSLALLVWITQQPCLTIPSVRTKQYCHPLTETDQFNK